MVKIMKMKTQNRLKLSRALKKKLARKQNRKKRSYIQPSKRALPKVKALFRNDITTSNRAYINIRDGKDINEVAARSLCENLWLKFQTHSDQHFLQEFAIDFDARFWEMDLTVALIERGHSVTCPKPGPDVCIEGDQKVWVEAIAPKAGKGPDKVPPVKFGEAQTVPNDQIILRYTSAIAEKFDRYKSYVSSGIISNNEPYVIAINGCQIPSARLDHNPPRIVRSVFPIGDEYLTINRQTGSTKDSGFIFRPSIKKSSGSDIPTDLFLREDLAQISAIIFSCSDCCNRPSKGNDWVVVHNPLAVNPICSGLFPCFKEYQATENGEGEYILDNIQSNTQ